MSKTINNLHYKTFDQLMAGVEQDLYMYANEGYIDRANYLKEIRKVNADLGLRINIEREAGIDVHDYVGLLPPDFLFLQLAVGCKVEYVRVPSIAGINVTETHTISKSVDPSTCTLSSCSGGGCNGPCDNCMWVTQKIGTKIIKHTDLKQLQLTQSSFGRCTDTCLNHHMRSHNQIRIEDDHANFSFKEGLVYINYLADMVDEENNVVILDHPLVNDYYEYAVKKRFFENMKINKEGDFLQEYQIMVGELKQARIRAIGFINTPEYGDIIRVFQDNRTRFYKKYVQYFDNSRQGFFKDHRMEGDRDWNNESHFIH